MIDSEAAAEEWLAGQDWCTQEAIDRLKTLKELLKAENERQNLVSTASLDQFWQRHAVDSAQLLQFIPRETGRDNHATTGPRETIWLDLGTGAGFPGVVVAIMQPEIEVHLVESRRKRVEWLHDVVRTLALERVTIHGERLERVETFPVTIITARAFAPLPRLLELSARFSTPDTLWLLPKGRSAVEEVSALNAWRHTFHVKQSLTDAKSGIVVGGLQGKLGSRP